MARVLVFIVLGVLKRRKKYKCVSTIGYKLSEDHRYFVESEEHNNCVFCLIDDKGPMTQEDISQYFNLTKMRICQIEKEAIKKVNKRISKFMY